MFRMIQLIYGSKGSGKTKRLIEMVNAEAKAADGNVVFMDDNKRYMYDVDREVRFVDVTEYNVDTEDKLYGFLCGMLAQNFDISAIYMDAFLHMIGKTPDELTEFFTELDILADKNNLKIVLNVSADIANIPELLKQYVV